VASVSPASIEELADVLREEASAARTIRIAGNDSKSLMGGPVMPSNVVVSTSALRSIQAYEPNDLTISVQAGVNFADLQRRLAENGQLIALDPPFSDQATVGGIVASNSSGPMRRAYGTARDLVIGMTFVTLEGKIVKSGGMVVKNVAGLDMGKLMIGSFGTLAAVASVNFRLHPLPRETRTFFYALNELDAAIEKRNTIVKSVLQPMAVDLISPAASARLGFRGYMVAVRASGSLAVLGRYEKELPGSDQIIGAEDQTFWQMVRDFSVEFLRRQPSGIVLRVSTKLKDIAGLLRLTTSDAVVCRAASGVSYIHLSSWEAVPTIWQAAAMNGWTAVVEYAPDEIRRTKDLWLSRDHTAAQSFVMMEKLKLMFDPKTILNKSRLYGRI
jgi:glycolate oxidase FAD binding subunit